MCNDDFKAKEEDSMSASLKPRTGAFILNNAKADKFLSQKENRAEKAIERFLKRQTKEDIDSQYKR